MREKSQAKVNKYLLNKGLKQLLYYYYVNEWLMRVFLII